MKKGIFAAAAVAALGFAMSASASTISYKIFDGSTQIGTGSSTSGTLVNGLGLDGNFTVSLDASGYAATAPNFSSTNFNIATGTLSSPSTLTIYVTNTGLTSGATGVMNTFTTNSLSTATANDFLGDTISNYYDTTDAAYGTGTLLATANFNGAGGFTGPIFSTLTPNGLYSETTIYTLNFAMSAIPDTISASSQITAAPTPEPNSLILLGTGLIGAAGMLFMRRRQAAGLL